jgi:hypothetical protein
MPYNLQVCHAGDSQFFSKLENGTYRIHPICVNDISIYIYPTIILKIRYQVKMTKICKFVISTSTQQAVKGTSRRKRRKIYLFVEERMHERIRILDPPLSCNITSKKRISLLPLRPRKRLAELRNLKLSNCNIVVDCLIFFWTSTLFYFLV